ncbi:MAG: DUF4340 domain-containing protein [Spirochaetota bacterium]
MAANGYFRRLIMMLLVLALLIAAVIAIPRIRKAIASKSAPRTAIFTLKEDAVSKFRLIYGGNDITAAKIRNTWRITSPANYPADPMEALANIKNFNSLAIRASITNRALVDSYGLSSPRMRFYVWEGMREHMLEAGALAFDGEGIYVREGGDMFVVEAIFVEALKKSIDDLRAKDFLAITARDVMMLTVGAITFKRQSRTNWTSSMAGTLDLNKVFELVQGIEQLRAAGFTPDGARAADYGIPERAVHVLMKLEDNTKRELYVAGDGKDAFAKRADEDTMYRIDASVRDMLLKPASYYLAPSSGTVR